MKILRIVEVVVVLLFTTYCIYTFMPMTKELINNVKTTESNKENVIQ